MEIRENMHKETLQNEKQNLSRQGPSAQPLVNTLLAQNHTLHNHKKTEFLNWKTESMYYCYNNKIRAKTTTSILIF